VDNEAKRIWLKYLPENRILPFDAKDNFWEMGEVGPCGPCTEIHYDRIGGRDAAAMVNMDDPDVLEIWNLVFMQFNRKPGGALEPLPDCSIDTGMGFERLTSIMQNKRSNYDTDIFTPLFDAIHKQTIDMPVYGGKLGAQDVGSIDMAYRVVADHIRTLSFAIADGAFPSNEGRGYVLRRVLRRAVRYGQDVLKMPKGAFAGLVFVLAELMQGVFPELKANAQLVYDVILDEEITFARTLAKGVIRFTKEADSLIAQGQKQFPTKLAFLLFDSMGFPFDLTELMAEERGLTLDKDGFEECLKAHVERSKNANKKGSGDEDTIRKLEAKETAYLENDLHLMATDHSTVYKILDDLTGCKVQAIFDGENFLESIELSDKQKNYGLVLDKSNFYYESGGQLADFGKLRLEGTELVLDVQNCEAAKGFIVHAGSLMVDEDWEDYSGARTIKVGDMITCEVDYARRGNLAKNHTCTHLLNFALRKVVAENIDQKGSLVSEEKFRFDFNSLKPVDIESLEKIEKIVRKFIADALPVYTKVVPLADAMKINTLRAVFGETYPDPVRVVTVGPSVDDVVADPLNPKWLDYSVELCGGTHLSKSSEARAYALVSEGGLAKGIRRIVCLTGEAAQNAEREAEDILAQIEVASTLTGTALVEEQKKLNVVVNAAVVSVSRRKEISSAMDVVTKKMMEAHKEALKKVTADALDATQAAIANGAKYLVYHLETDGSQCPKIQGEITKKLKKNAVALLFIQGNSVDDSVLISACVPKGQASLCSAKEWLLASGAACGAQGGGSDTACNGKGAGVGKIQACIDAANVYAGSKFN